MDNQFFQPGAGQPGVGQPGQGYPPAGYPGTPVPPQPPVNPYEALTPGPQPDPYAAGYQPMQGNPYATGPQPVQGNPYATGPQPVQGNPYATGPQPVQGNPYATGPQPVQGNPYENVQQGVPYGGVQHPYADPGAMQQPYSENGYERKFGQQGQTEGTQEAPQQGGASAKPHGRAFAGAEAPPVPGAKRRMSGSDIALIVVALLAVIGFAGWYLYATYAPEVARTGVVATGSLSAIHSGSVLIVRNEIPYDAEGVNAIIYETEEGGRVDRNSIICYIYSTGYSASAMRQLQEYRDSIRDYQKDLIVNSVVYDVRSDRYNTEVLTLAKEIRSLMAGDDGSLSNIETQLNALVTERQLYFDQKYAPDQRFSRMKDDERSQMQRINSWMQPQKGNTDALVSFYADGYEYVINGSNYMNFEPDQVRQMINGVKPEGAAPSKGRSTIYRLVKDNEWYALFLSNDTEWNPVVGETYELQLERFGDAPVTATVVNFTKAGGELLVRLRIVGSVPQVMYLRTCDAVLAESMTTLMVNERAIHIQDEMTGVVVIEDNTESFIPVNVIHTVDGYAYFQTVQQGLLFEGMTVRLFD